MSDDYCPQCQSYGNVHDPAKHEPLPGVDHWGIRPFIPRLPRHHHQWIPGREEVGADGQLRVVEDRCFNCPATRPARPGTRFRL